MYTHARELDSKDVEGHGTEAMAQPKQEQITLAYSASLKNVTNRIYYQIKANNIDHIL